MLRWALRIKTRTPDAGIVIHQLKANLTTDDAVALYHTERSKALLQALNGDATLARVGCVVDRTRRQGN
jgi:hypothetical protein